MRRCLARPKSKTNFRALELVDYAKQTEGNSGKKGALYFYYYYKLDAICGNVI